MLHRHDLRGLLPVTLSLITLLLSGWLTLLAPQSVAYAHAFVIGSDPVDGSTVANAPRVVRIFFAAAISPASIAHVYTPDEHIVDATRSSISPSNLRELDTPLKNPDQLPQGGYTVRWTALADGDGHTTQGVIGFNIGHSSTGLPGQVILGPSTSNCLPQLIGNDNTNCGPSFNLLGFLSIAWEWLVLMALTFWVGMLITEGLLLNGLERIAALFTATRKQARPLQWLCLTAMVVGEVILLILRTAQFSQANTGGDLDFAILLSILTHTTYGYLWLSRLALVLLALVLLWWPNRPHSMLNSRRHDSHSGQRFRQIRQRVTQEASPTDTSKTEEAVQMLPATLHRYTIAWLILASLIIFTNALSDYVASLAQPHISAIILDWLYLIARAVWFGSVAYLGYVLLPLLPVAEPDRPAEVLLPLLRRFYPLVLAAMGVFLVSGLFLAESSISSPSQLLSDPYGRTLLIHCLLIALILVVTAYAFFLLRPKLTRQAALLPVVNAEMPARRTRQSALEQTSRRLKQSLNLQSWLGAAVLLCAALMTFFAPPIVFPNINYAQSQAAPSTNTTSTPAQTAQVGNLSVTLQVLPGRVNYANEVLVTLNDTAGNAVTNATIQISINMEIMDMGTAHTTLKGGSPVYTATFPKDATFSMAGVWDIQLTIQRPHQSALQTIFSVTLAQ